MTMLINAYCFYAGSLRRPDTTSTVGEVTSLMSSVAENERGKSNKVYGICHIAANGKFIYLFYKTLSTLISMICLLNLSIDVNRRMLVMGCKRLHASLVTIDKIEILSTFNPTTTIYQNLRNFAHCSTIESYWT